METQTTEARTAVNTRNRMTRLGRAAYESVALRTGKGEMRPERFSCNTVLCHRLHPPFPNWSLKKMSRRYVHINKHVEADRPEAGGLYSIGGKNRWLIVRAVWFQTIEKLSYRKFT